MPGCARNKLFAPRSSPGRPWLHSLRASRVFGWNRSIDRKGLQLRVDTQPASRVSRVDTSQRILARFATLGGSRRTVRDFFQIPSFRTMRRMNTGNLSTLVVLSIVVSGAASAANEQTVFDFVQKHCVGCHNDKKTSGDLNLRTLQLLGRAKRLTRVARRGNGSSRS